MTVTTLAGRVIEAKGQVIGGRAILRLREVSGIKYELAELARRHQKQTDDAAAVRALIEAVSAPVWARDEAGKLVFVNQAYARAVEATDGADAVERGIELFDRGGRSELLRAHEAAQCYSARLPAVVAGQRRSFDVMSVPAARGSAGIGIDATEAELMRAELKRMVDAHRRTLDQLATGVAIFGSNQRLGFYNAAYRLLWDLDSGFLDQGPTDSAVLDQLRAARKLPDEQDFRQWKTALYEAYRAVEAKEHMWHLPDGRTLRVVTTPNPEGGVIYLFDDVTERLDLERRYDALIRVQGETLDNLTEAVAVFGSDGRLHLYNPVFALMWRLSARCCPSGRISNRSAIGREPLHGDHPLWQRLRATITAIDNREPVIGRIERPDGNVGPLRHHAAPRRRHAGDLPGRDRHRQCRARATRAQRGVEDCRQDQDRFRASRVLRAALAAHQHHRLCPFPRRPRHRSAHGQAARISQLHHGLDQRARLPSSTTSSTSPPSMPAP